MDDYLLKGGHVLDPFNAYHMCADVLIRQGRIEAVAPGLSPVDCVVLDVREKLVIPGLTDLSMHMDARLLDVRVVAAQFGIGHSVLWPTKEPSNSTEGLSCLEPLIQWQGIQPCLADVDRFYQQGILDFVHIPNPHLSYAQLLNAMRYLSQYPQAKLWVKPQEPSFAAEGCLHESDWAFQWGLPMQSALAEVLVVQNYLALARDCQLPLHFSCLSSLEAVNLIRHAKAQGQAVTADVSIHHLCLSQQDCPVFESWFKLSPPLRTVQDRDALQQGLLDGVIDAVSANHAFFCQDDKHHPFPMAVGGVAGGAYFLSALLGWATRCGICLQQALHWVTVAAQQVLAASPPQSHTPGLKPGALATLMVFDWNPAGAGASLIGPQNWPFSSNASSMLSNQWLNIFSQGQRLK